MVDRGRQDQEQRRDKFPFSIILDTTDATKKDGEWEMVATATVLYHRRHAPRPPKEVIFQVDGTEVERLPTNDESGQAVTTIVFPQPGSYLLGAFLADEPGVRYVKRINIKVEEKKPPKPKKLYVTFGGPRGRQRLRISVSGEDGSLLRGFKGVVVDGSKETTFTTQPNGLAVYNMDFKERRRYVEVRVGNEHDLIWRASLVGPKKPTQQELAL